MATKEHAPKTEKKNVFSRFFDNITRTLKENPALGWIVASVMAVALLGLAAATL